MVEADPHAGQLLGSDGSFYGTTVNGGSYDLGTVFNIPVAGAGVPLLQPLSLSGNSFGFRWMGLAGHSYQVQYKTNLNQNAWLNLGANITATGGTLTVTDAATNAQRFYRVMLQP